MALSKPVNVYTIPIQKQRGLTPLISICDYGSNIYLGERVYFNFNCVVLDVCEVKIGDFTFFGSAVQIYTATHPMDAHLRRTQEFGKPVTIGSDVWVGGGAIICPGVTIGSRSVIGAGSVVTWDIPERRS